MRTSWQLKQNAPWNSARSRVSAYARMLQPGEKPQRCCSPPGKLLIKARTPAASLPIQWAPALPGYEAPRFVGSPEILVASGSLWPQQHSGGYGFGGELHVRSVPASGIGTVHPPRRTESRTHRPIEAERLP